MIDELKKKLNREKKIYLDVRVVSGASKTEIKNVICGGVIKINVKAVPEKGKANFELIKFLSKSLGVNRKNIKIIKGSGSQFKLLKIQT